MLSNPRPLIVGYLAVIPDRHREKARRTLIRMMEQMTAWARGVAINGVITGASTGILLWAVGVQPAFVFGVLAFFGEFLPNIGPVLVAFPVLFVALSISVTKFWLALAAILFVQQVEVTLPPPRSSKAQPGYQGEQHQENDQGAYRGDFQDGVVARLLHIGQQR